MRVGMIVLAGLLVSVASGPAAAQSPWIERGYYEGLPTRVIMRMVRSRGLMPVSRPMRRGPHYLVDAEDDFGRLRRVVIDARSARIVRVEVAGRTNFARRGPDGEPHSFAMRPPRSVPEAAPDFPDEDGYGDTGPERRPLPPLRPRASLPDEPEVEEAPEPRRSLPPLRPRASVPQEEAPEVITGPQRDGARALPPPPSPERRAAPPPVRQPTGEPRPAARSAAVNPSAPPIPRPRPAQSGNAPAGSETAGTGAAPAATPSPRKGLPRVVLPGGPTPRSERTADTRPGQREHEPSATASPAPAASTAEQEDHSATHAIPPVQPLN